MNYYLHKKEESMVMMRLAIHIYIGGLKPAMMVMQHTELFGPLG